jgi:preprotein translocase subunit YajC
MNLITIFLMTTPSGSSSGAGWMNLVLLLAVFAVMYFFMIRPQSKNAKEQRTFLETLQKGDKIVTVAGIHGRISKVNESGTLEVEIDTNTKVIMERSGISMEYTRGLQGNTTAQK